MSEASAFAARHSCDSPEWYTPSAFVEAAREVMGGIDLDPMSHAEANLTVKATRFFDETVDGLTQTWQGRLFVNPPGGLVTECWRKLLDEPYHSFIWIGYSLEQLQTLQVGRAFGPTPMDFPLCIPSRRIAFVENEAKKMLRIAKLLEQGEVPGASEARRKVAANIRAGKEPPNSPSHANYISYNGPDYHKFSDVFGQFGQVRK